MFAFSLSNVLPGADLLVVSLLVGNSKKISDEVELCLALIEIPQGCVLKEAVFHSDNYFEGSELIILIQQEGEKRYISGALDLRQYSSKCVNIPSKGCSLDEVVF